MQEGLWCSHLDANLGVGGISHAPQELTAWPDIEKGANLMLAALLELCAA